MSKRKKRIIAAVVSTAIVVGLFLMIQQLQAAWRVDRVRQLAEQLKGLPREKAKAARGELWAAAKSLAPEERRQVFEEAANKRLDDFFKLSSKDRIAYLDQIIKRDLQRQAARKKQARATPKAQANSARVAGAGGQGQGGQGGPGGGRPGGPGGWGGRNLSPEQRAEFRRTRLDQTNPMARGRRAEFASAMRDRRTQLGLPPGSGRRR